MARVDRCPSLKTERREFFVHSYFLRETFLISGQIKLRPEAFYAPAHQILFNLVAELVDSNKPIDFITLKQALKDRVQLDEIGGPEYLSDLFSFVPSAANADYYVDIIREKYLLRQMIMTCNRVVSDCYDHPRGGGRSVGPR